MGLRKLFVFATVLAVATSLVTASPALAASESGACNSNVSGDFNGDGFDDLAVGVPGQTATDDPIDQPNAGAVHVIYGSGVGLDPAAGLPDQVIDQDTVGVDGGTETGDRFGACVAAGNFDGDAFDDLAIGIPSESLGDTFAGAVSVIYGSTAGLDAEEDVDHVADQLWHQDSPGIPGINEDGDGFGSSLATGDFNDDGEDDLAIGVPTESVSGSGGAVNTGAVMVILGDPNDGLTSVGAQHRYQGDGAVRGRPGRNDNFGAALAAGDFDDDGRDDLAVGVPGERLRGERGAGAVQVFEGRSGGLSPRGKIWHQNTRRIRDRIERRDHFGEALAAGDLDADGIDDLVVGAPGEKLGRRRNAVGNTGVIHVIRGTTKGLRPGGNTRITQRATADAAGDTSESRDRFGSVLVTGDYNDDGLDDIAVGVPREDLVDDDEGAVEVIDGIIGELPDGGAAQFITQDDTNDAGEEDDLFGAALATGDFDGDDVDDLAVGVPQEGIEGADPVTEVGAVEVMYGMGAMPLDPAASQFIQQGRDGFEGTAERNDHFGSSLG